MCPQLIPINKPEQLQANGIPFSTEHQVRWALRQSHDNGLGSAFIRIGRRIYIDPDKFHELVRRNRAV